METVKLDTIIKDIKRGMRIRMPEFREMISHEKTNTRFLKLGNVENGGLIEEGMEYLKDDDENLSKYCLKENDVLLSKIGSMAKTLVAHDIGNKKIVASENYYIITLDTEKADPDYIAAYFTSETGQDNLSQCTVGARIPTLSIHSAKNFDIPLPSMDEQKKIAQKYRDTVKEIQDLNHKLEKAKKTLYNLI